MAQLGQFHSGRVSQNPLQRHPFVRLRLRYLTAFSGFLCVMVGTILYRTVNKDLRAYNAMDLTAEGIQEDYGWRLVATEVFRPPRHRMALSVAIGTGCQLAAMASTTLVFALLGFLSPSSRGSLSTIMLVLYMLFGCVSGFVSAIAYATMQGQEWRMNALATALGYPR